MAVISGLREADTDEDPIPLTLASATETTAPQRADHPRPTGADFTPERLLRPRATAPSDGWRRLVYRASAGTINPGPGEAELRRTQLLARVKTPVADCRRVAIISRKGGIGKTTTTLMLGHTFAVHRGDRVVALDANPDAGSLGYRVKRQTTATVADLLEKANEITRYADVRSYTSQAPTRLEVIAAADDPRMELVLGWSEYQAVLGVLERHYNLILCDTGTGIIDDATQGILNRSDQVVLCASASIDGSRASSFTLDWLEAHKFDDVARDAVVVINALRGSSLVQIEELENHFRKRCRAVVRIPHDRQLEAGAETTLDELSSSTRDAYLELAAAVADGFISNPNRTTN
ncbi:MAG: MinD/ParA family ATP-binding protein [Candidatus Dormibacteria bacterium]